MTPRPRKRGSKDLPSNLYAQNKCGKTYYRYRHPITGTYTGFGSNRAEAIKAAKQLNQILLQKSDLLSKVLMPDELFGDYIEYFSDEILSRKMVNGEPLSQKTLSEYRRVLRTIHNELGHHGWNIQQRDIAEYLNSRSSSEVYNKHRSMLVMLFRQAVSDQKINDNLAERIVKRDAEKTKRATLTIEMYDQIYQKATPSIRNAMELSLNALQRRADIQKWRFDSRIEDHYRVVINKTRKHGRTSYIEIPAKLPVVHSAAGSKTLDDIIKRCRDGLVCPYLIHEKPQRHRISKEKEHAMQLSLKQISDGFANARDLAGIKMDNPPTFHELLALGEALRFKQGWSTKQIQSLRGHRKEKTTQDYIDKQIEWVRVDVPNL